MTEFKKCVETVDDVRNVVPYFHDHAKVDSDVAAAKRLLDKYDDDVVPQLRVRIAKLLAKAREKDPDKQIYNESMCLKIEDLAKAAEIVCADFDAAIPYAHHAVHTMLKRRVLEQAQHAAIAQSAGELFAQDAEARQLLKYEYTAWVRATSAEMSTAYDVALAKKKAREAREWQVEVDRRAAELAEFHARVARLSSSGSVSYGAAAVADYLAAGVSDVKTLTRHLVALLDGLVSDPSNVNITKLRNNNSVFLSHFGHPLAAPATPDDVLADMDAQEARSTYHAAEVALCAVGYRPQYEVRSDFARPTPPPGSAWVVPTCPWDLYSERFLVLREPDPAVDTEAWMSWHERLGDLHKHFSQLLSHPPR